MAAVSSPSLPTSSNTMTTSSNPITKINIGTRRSQLAIAQVDSIIQQLKALHLASPDIEYVSTVVSTMADENQVKSFSAFDSKSIWTEELEALLAKGELDVVVHCLKGSSTISQPSSKSRSARIIRHPLPST
jgi:hydroxymethylbilane synthase